MAIPEKQLGIIRDVLLPVDAKTRYDLYFTDKRIAIVCLGRASRFESDSQGSLSVMPSAFGVPAPIITGQAPKRTVDEEIVDWALDDLLRLSKKSCYYTYEEVEEVKLILGRRAKFEVISEECESKFAPTEEQVKQLMDLLPKIEALRNKLFVAGGWNTLREVFKRQL